METGYKILRSQRRVKKRTRTRTSGTRRRGREKGSKNKSTIQRELLAKRVRDYLHMRAPYQSPRLSAVQVVPQQAAKRTTVNVTILNERGEKVFSDVREEEDMKRIEARVRLDG
jgi:hypothetical protein